MKGFVRFNLKPQLKRLLTCTLALQIALAPLHQSQAASGQGFSKSAAFQALYQDFKNSFRNTARFSPLNIFSTGFKGQNLYLEGVESNGRKTSEHNRYRTGLGMGINEQDGKAPRPTTQMFKENLSRLPLMFSENYTQSQTYQEKLLTERGQKELLRQFRWTVDALSVSQKVNYLTRYENEIAKIRAEVRSEIKADPKLQTIPDTQRHSLTTIRSYERFLADHIKAHGENAARLIRADQAFLRDAQQRGLYNYRFGLSSLKVPNLNPVTMFTRVGGKIIGNVADPFGKGTLKVDVTPHASELAKINLPTFIDQIKSGTVTASKYTVVLGGLLYMFNQSYFLADYASNPTGTMDTLEKLTTPGYYLGMFGFFLGGSTAGHMTNAIFTNNRALSTLHSLQTTGGLFANKPMSHRLIQASNISALSYSGLAAGFLASKTLEKWGNKLWACNQLFLIDDNQGDAYRSTKDPERPLSQARIPQWEKKGLEETCQMGFLDFAKSVATDHQTWITILSLYNARALLLGFANWSSLVKVGRFPQEASLAAGGRSSLRLVSRGLKSPLLGTLGGAAAFIAIAWLTEKFIIVPAYNYVDKQVPLERYKQNSVSLSQDFERNKFDPEGVCKGDQFFNGIFRGTINKVYALFSGESTQKCGEEMFSDFYNNQAQTEHTWRQNILKPSSDVIMNWMRYANQTMNIYRASRLFYKDIYEQVRIARENQPLAFPKRTDAQDGTLKYDDPASSWEFYDHPLPLFRSSPYFGWDVKLRGAEGSDTMAPVDHTGNGVNWRERFNTQHGVEQLKARRRSFNNEIVPAVRDDLKRVISLMEADSEKDVGPKKRKRAAVKDIYQKLYAGAWNIKIHALERFSYEQSLEFSNSFCYSPENYHDLNLECPLTHIQSKYLDPQIWKWNNIEKNFEFRGQAYPIFMGYQRTQSLSPFGVQPLSRGQEFLLSYDERLSSMGVDMYYHELKGEGMTYVSMTDYMLKSMICGASPENQKKGLLKNEWAYNWGWDIPKFSAPRLPLRGQVKPCDIPTQRDTRTGEWSKGWKNNTDFYHRIEDSENRERYYGGIVEFLYNEIDFDKAPDFDQWWDSKVRPHFEAVMDRLYKDYINRVIDKHLNEALNRNLKDAASFENERSIVVNNGYLGSLKLQMQNYFANVLTPKIHKMEMDLSYVSGMSESDARAFLIKEYEKLKTQYLSLFEYLTGDRQALHDQELIAELEEYKKGLYYEATGQADYIPNSSRRGLMVKSQSEAHAILAIMKKKLLDLRRLFKVDDDAMIGLLAQAFIAAIDNDSSLDHETKSEMKERVIEEQAAAEQAFNEEMDRDGHVLLNHKWIETTLEDGSIVEYSPSVNVGKIEFDAVEVLGNELAMLMGLRDSLMSLKDIDSELNR